jgi:hypothetical protein
MVIWATGYQTQTMPIKDTDGKCVTLHTKVPYTQHDIDSKCRLITADNNLLLKLFGSGLAFPMRSNDGMT